MKARLPDESGDIDRARVLLEEWRGASGVVRTREEVIRLSIEEALPRAADVLYESGLKERIRLVASGKLVTSARAASTGS